jgi:hypothetical protein
MSGKLLQNGDQIIGAAGAMDLIDHIGGYLEGDTRLLRLFRHLIAGHVAGQKVNNILNAEFAGGFLGGSE